MLARLVLPLVRLLGRVVGAGTFISLRPDGPPCPSPWVVPVLPLPRPAHAPALRPLGSVDLLRVEHRQRGLPRHLPPPDEREPLPPPVALAILHRCQLASLPPHPPTAACRRTRVSCLLAGSQPRRIAPRILLAWPLGGLGRRPPCESSSLISPARSRSGRPLSCAPHTQRVSPPRRWPPGPSSVPCTIRQGAVHP